MDTNFTNKETGKLVYPELSYVIMGVLFEVSNKLGTKYQEKHYQRAIEIKLKELGVPFEREVKTVVRFGGKKLGDFLLTLLLAGEFCWKQKRFGGLPRMMLSRR